MVLVPHLPHTEQTFSLLQSGNDSSPRKGKVSFHIILYFLICGTHLGNQQVQQDHNHSKQEGQIHDNREPPGEGEGESHTESSWGKAR